MLAGTLMMVGLMLTAGVSPGDVVYLNQQRIKIPLDIKPADRPQIHELALFVSTDEGRNWHQEAVCAPEQDGFKFVAPADGLYWFTVAVTDRNGRQTPRDVVGAAPSQKMIIDTLKPQVRIVQAERRDDEVVVAWEIQEDHPDLGSLRLEYHPADAAPGNWYNAPLELPGLIGRTRFRVHTPGAVTVRLLVQDLAKNQGGDEKDIAAPSVVTTAGLVTTKPREVEPAPAACPFPAPAAEPPAHLHTEAPFPTVPLVPPASGPVRSNDGEGRLAATTDSTAGTFVPPAGGGEPRVKAGGLPPVRVVKDRQVTLEYALDKVGPSGIGTVELWLTKDDGVNWQRYAEDGEVKTPMSNGRYQRTVELPGEGLFGISLVVRSRAGLGKAPPKPGDPPQMRIEVDLTPPAAQLFVPTPDPRRRDSLVLSWTARDRNLAANPITLQWAERKGGVWQTIAANQANSGRYVWQLPANGLPDRVYLRLVVRDSAGNEGVAETPEPQLVDLSEPEGTILGVVNGAGQP